MPPLIKLQDAPLALTSDYPYASWKFEKFNPVQSSLVPYYEKDNSGLIAAATSAGKTVCAEMFLAQEMRKRGGKGMFLAPLRALAQEKIDDWTDEEYHFKDKNIAICTGDYRLTKERHKELCESDLIIMTSEMLNHRCRNYKSEQNSWIKDVGTLVIDESHLLTVPGRGDHLEVGLMKFSEINPHARMILLSATMPNVEQIAEWISYILTKREAFVLTSSYRPCPLSIHYEKYYDGHRTYEENEQEKVNQAIDIVEHYDQDKFLIFAHTKRTGENMKKTLLDCGIQAEFHNADLEKKQRIEVERKFRTDPKLRVIVATSTLAWGLNMPARRVIVLGVHRGMDEVATYDITQMIGRAGRPAFDKMGDAYILVPESKADYHKERLKKPQKIQSQLLETVGDGIYKVLAFHLVAGIHHGEIKTKDDVHAWYERSLAHYQARDLNDEIVDDTLERLQKMGAIRLEEDEYKATAVGMVSSMFYFSPFDVADLRKNFNDLFSSNRQLDDYALSMALGNLDTFRFGIVSKAEREEMGTYQARIQTLFGGKHTDAAVKAGFCYYNLLNGLNSHVLAGQMRNIQFDTPRLMQVLSTLDSMGGKWGEQKYFNTVEMRVRKGVKAELIDLCRIPNIAKERAKKLYAAGLKTVEDVADESNIRLRTLLNLNEKKVQEMLDEAKKLAAS